MTPFFHSIVTAAMLEVHMLPQRNVVNLRICLRTAMCGILHNSKCTVLNNFGRRIISFPHLTQFLFP